MKKANNNSINVSVDQLAEVLGCTSITAWKLVSKDNVFPGAFRLTNRPHSPWRIPRAEVVGFMTRPRGEVLGG